MTDAPTTPALLPIAATPSAGPIRGRDIAEANTDPAWSDTAMAAIVAMARTGRTFEAYTLVAELGVPEPDKSCRWGAVFARAHRQGVILRVGAVQSSRRTVAKSLTSVWRGNSDYFEPAIPAAPRRARPRCLTPTRTRPRPATP